MFITECPRDAMQGIHTWIPTQVKVDYHKKLLACGFPMLDFGSFVSPRAIPQLKDSAEVAEQIAPFKGVTKLLAIVANERGAKEALAHPAVDAIGFPFSVSETFQQRNTNASKAEAMGIIQELVSLSNDAGKEAIIYLSMAFGNPYDEIYNQTILNQDIEALVSLGAKQLMLSDTVGVATVESIEKIVSGSVSAFPEVLMGCHLHSTPNTQLNKIETALRLGIRRIDGALLGFGGCPMAEDDLVGNIDTRAILTACEMLGLETNLNEDAVHEAIQFASWLFATYK